MSILPKPLPPLKTLQELFYVSETSPSGLRWKNSRNSRCKLGDIAGYKHHTGYWDVKITLERSGKAEVYRAHRVVYFLQTGNNPGLLQVDHINGKEDPINLRLATKTENLWNKSRQKNASSKYKGVYWDKAHKKWRVTVTKNKKRTHIGRFDSETEAAIAYNLAAEKCHGKFAKLNKID